MKRRRQRERESARERGTEGKREVAVLARMISRLIKNIGLFSEYRLFYRALLQKRPIILRSLLIDATPWQS